MRIPKLIGLTILAAACAPATPAPAPVPAPARPVAIAGCLVDSLGAGVPAPAHEVTAYLLGARIGARTDSTGFFSLTASDFPDVLRLSRIGLATVERRLDAPSASTLNLGVIALRPVSAADIPDRVPLPLDRRPAAAARANRLMGRCRERLNAIAPR